MNNSNLDRCISFAKREKWDEVDNLLPTVAREFRSVMYAIDSLLSEGDANLRDLGASILQKADLSEEHRAKALPLLYSVMHAHPGSYDGFRAACALVVHAGRDSRSYTSEIRRTLNRFTKDTDVGRMACGYLGALARR